MRIEKIAADEWHELSERVGGGWFS